MKYERKGKKWKDRKISRNISIRVSSLLVSFSNRRLEIVFFLSNDDVGCRKTSRKRNGIRYRHAIEADQGAASKRLSSVSRSRSRCAASTVVDVEFLRRSPGRITSTRRVSSIRAPLLLFLSNEWNYFERLSRIESWFSVSAIKLIPSISKFRFNPVCNLVFC